MIRVLLTCLALLALASPTRAATVIACQDANGSDYPVSPQYPCAVQGTAGGLPIAVASPVIASSLTPTVQAASYASGNTFGGLLSFTSVARVAAGSGLIQSVMASFTSGVVPAMDLILFSANPTGSTVTDKTALAIATADVGKIIGVIHITDCVLGGASAPSLCQAQQQAFPFVLPAGTTVYAALVARAAVTLTSTTDLTVTIRALQN